MVTIAASSTIQKQMPKTIKNSLRIFVSRTDERSRRVKYVGAAGSVTGHGLGNVRRAQPSVPGAAGNQTNALSLILRERVNSRASALENSAAPEFATSIRIRGSVDLLVEPCFDPSPKDHESERHARS